MYEVILSKAFSSITAFTKFVKSSGSPIFIVESSFNRFSLIGSHKLSGIYTLDGALHFCP